MSEYIMSSRQLTGSNTDTACNAMIEAAIKKCLAAWQYKREPKLSKVFDSNFKKVIVCKL
jgi:hypothetical protein